MRMGLSPSEVAGAFQSCLWLRSGRPMTSCVIAECVNTIDNAGTSGIWEGGQGQAWQKRRPLPMSCCQPAQGSPPSAVGGRRRGELGKGCRRCSGQMRCAHSLHALWEARPG